MTIPIAFDPPSVTLSGVTREFGDPPLTALAGISLSASPGTFVAVVGASGCGKSTLLRLAGGLDEPTRGEILVDGEPPDIMRRRKDVGWMAQRPALLPWRTVLENVALAQRINPQPDRSLPEPGELLEMVGLADFAGAHPGTLSGGMQQRVSLARTLATGARLWLMDEPFAALDELSREALADELLAIWRQVGSTVLWVTHHLPEAVKLADRLLLLTPRPGQVAAELTIDLPRPRDESSLAFQALVRQARDVLRAAQDGDGAVPIDGRLVDHPISPVSTRLDRVMG